LKGAGGVLVGLPLLSALRANAQENAFPTRLVLIYQPNGTVPDAFWPSPTQDERTFELGPILEPLAAHRDQLLLLKGLTLAVASDGPGGPHQKGVGGLFTGRKLGEGVFADGCGSLAGWATGVSVDQHVANALGRTTLLPSLELGVRATKADVQSRISYAGADQPLPPLNAPSQVHARLFAEIDADPAVLAGLRVRRRSVLDAVKDQFTSLSSRLGTDDRDKLELHASLVRDVERRLDIIVEAGSCAAPDEPAYLQEDSEETMEEIARLQVDLLAIALSCGLTRVASLQFSDAFNRIRIPWVNSLREGHSLSHAGENDTDAQTQLIARQRWYSSQVARLLDQLAVIPEGDGSVLDHTLIVWGNEVGVGRTHTHENIPFVLAGGAGGAIRTGRLLDFGGRSHSDHLVSILNAMGLEDTTFGDPAYVSGPLPGLL
jgi:hypothetical protein